MIEFGTCFVSEESIEAVAVEGKTLVVFLKGGHTITAQGLPEDDFNATLKNIKYAMEWNDGHHVDKSKVTADKPKAWVENPKRVMGPNIAVPLQVMPGVVAPNGNKIIM